MNTPYTHRIASFALAALLTVAMLAGVNGLAASDAPDALLARVAASQNA